MRKLVLLAATLLISGCGVASFTYDLIRPCSSARPCDARPRSYRRAERAEAKKAKLQEGALVFAWRDKCRVDGGPCLVMYKVTHGKLVEVK